MHDSVIIGERGLKSRLINIFFPNRCPFCGGFIEYDLLCCEECFGEILWTDESLCPKCGKVKSPVCACGNKLGYDMCAAAAFYEGAAKKGVLSLKYNNNLNAAAIFGRVLREKLIIMGVWESIDAAVPVPMSPRQKRARGYNQAEVIARRIAEGSDIPLRNDVIFRRYSRQAQHTLSAAERQVAAEKTYYRRQTDGKPLAGMTVLLTDDVLTTGATMSACAGLLKELGAERVICAAAATV